MDILAFDVGTDVIGILDMKSGSYEAYRGKRKTIAAERLISCHGVIISYNGTDYDVPQLARLLGKGGVEDLGIQAEHLDMREIASRDRWPPDPGTSPIRGQSLLDTYGHYFPNEPTIHPPDFLIDEYEIDNWRDCWMAGQLWTKLFLQ